MHSLETMKKMNKATDKAPISIWRKLGLVAWVVSVAVKQIIKIVAGRA